MMINNFPRQCKLTESFCRVLLCEYAAITSLCLLMVATGCQQIRPEEVRGPLLENKLVNSTEQKGMIIQLISGSTANEPQLQIIDKRIISSEFRPYYQKILRHAQPGETDPDFIRYQEVQDETLTGPVFSETREASGGPLAGVSLNVNGNPGSTDAKGVFTDNKQEMLSVFDDFSANTLNLKIESPGLTTFTFSVTRQELLTSLGVKMELDRRFPAGHENIHYQVVFPEKITTGGTYEIILVAENRGSGRSFGIMGRLISRHSWLDGLNFYIGQLDPGTKRSFRRVLQVPRTLPAQDCHAVIGIASILGPHPEAKLPLRMHTLRP